MKRLLVAMTFALATPATYAATFTGVDAAGSANSDAAFLAWSATVSGLTTETFDGLAVNGGSSGVSPLGNSLSAASGSTLASYVYTTGVINGANLQLTKGLNQAGGFTWNLATPSDAFGIFGWDNDGGTITVAFVAGGQQTFSVASSPTGGVDSFFWGISGLTDPVSSVTVTTTDPGTNSLWDNFVYGTSVPGSNGTAPEPATLALAALGLTALGFTRRRRK